MSNNGKFKPGQSGNPAGRPRGAKDKTGETYRQLVKQIVTENWEAIQEGIDGMDAKEKAFFLERLLKNYIISPPTNWLESMTDEDFDVLLRRIKEEASHN